VVFGQPWAALGAFGQPLGLHFSPLGIHWGASRRHWAPFVACGGPLDAIRGHWGSLLGSLGDYFERNFSCCSDLKTFEDLYICLKKNTKNPNCELDPLIVNPNVLKKKRFFSPKCVIELDPLFVGPHALHINSFTRLL